MANWKATRRRRRIRRLAVERLAKELGLTVAALEREAWRMARAKKELSKSVVTFKLERHGIKLTKDEEMEIARVHHVLTMAIADLRRNWTAIGHTESGPRTLLRAAQRSMGDAEKYLLLARPTALCSSCKRQPTIMPGCATCEGRGWI